MTDKELIEYIRRIEASAEAKTASAHRAGILAAGLEQVKAVLEAREEL